ncbi:hypothetical protein [Stenotrophomonas maltophilia]|uniref:hypothetical protein n=1 Tax=Stenotrophomonas maltophilia TaxID=40324 RepID=UPI00128BB041|nr:hypothetical protein [Stenotrophomonas maltophilia]
MESRTTTPIKAIRSPMIPGKSLADAGLRWDVLENFGLENKVVSAGQKKPTFHAKFYAGIADDWSEVYFGSANLVRGPSSRTPRSAE